MSACIQTNVEPIQQGLRLAIHPLVVENEPEWPGARLATDEDVLGHREVAHQAEFLMNDADAHIAGGTRRGYVHFDALEQDATSILWIDAGEHLHQRRLASPVFAAQGVDFTRSQVEPAFVERVHAREGLVDAFHAHELA